jgi:hypothetical protein
MNRLADLVLLIHMVWVLTILVPIPLIWIGSWRNWSWVRNYIFRVIHLSMIGVVILESVLGLVCPLTVLEDLLRTGTNQASYGETSFIEYWLGRVLFYDFPSWSFTLAYIVFGFLILFTFIKVPPRRRAKRAHS